MSRRREIEARSDGAWPKVGASARNSLIVLVLALAACNSSDSAPGSVASGAAPDAAPAVAASEPAQPSSDAPKTGDAAAADMPGTRYACENGLAVTARYGTTDADDGVTLSIKDKSYRLASAVSASGSKYESAAGMTPGKSLVWWSKGSSAMLIEAPAGDQSGENEEVVNCDEVA